ALQAAQVGIERIVDVGGRASRIEKLIAVGQAQRVESQFCHLVQHVLVVADGEAVWRERLGLKAKPVHAREYYLISVRVHHTSARGLQRATSSTSSTSGRTRRTKGRGTCDKGGGKRNEEAKYSEDDGTSRELHLTRLELQENSGQAFYSFRRHLTEL